MFIIEVKGEKYLKSETKMEMNEIIERLGELEMWYQGNLIRLCEE